MSAQSENASQPALEHGCQEPLLAPQVPSGEDERREAEATLAHYEFEVPARPWWKGNVNLYLGVCYVIVFWFVVGRGTWRFTLPISTMAAVHIIAACTYGVICCVNVFHTPGHGALYRRVHMALGRVAMGAGLLSVALGMVVLYAEENPLGLRIGLTYAAVAQIATQVLGMYELFRRKRNLKKHAYYMRQSLLFCCLIPALMRMPQLTGISLGDGWQAISWVLAVPLYMFNERAFTRKTWL